MSYTAFYVGLTGLKAHSSVLGNIGNNLANLSTVGYKRSRTAFADLFSAGSGLTVTKSGGSIQSGLGVQLSAVQQLFNQGTLQPTDVVTDLALQGRGFFVLRDPRSGAESFSRAGNFSFDSEGYLVSQAGTRVQGFTDKDPDGNIVPSGRADDIRVEASQLAPPRLTSFFRADMNLNSDAQIDNPATTIDEAEEFATTVTIFDSLGDEHKLSLTFRRTAPGVWDWTADADPAELAGSLSGNAGTITFDENGQLVSPTNPVISFPGWANGAGAQDVEWLMVDPETSAGTIQSYSAASGVDALFQDGYTVGRIRGLAIDDTGLISGIFTNGQSLQLAQIALASFNNEGGLFRTGDNGYIASIASGQPAIGSAGTGSRGSVVSQALELSNVDITEQFTSLIVAERGYQANSRTITTTDSVIQEALSIKR